MRNAARIGISVALAGLALAMSSATGSAAPPGRWESCTPPAGTFIYKLTVRGVPEARSE